MNRNRGNRTAQRKRRLERRRERGCEVCGIHGGCTGCDLGAELVAIHGYRNLSLVVDGSFVPITPVPASGPVRGYGGAGLVLVLGIPRNGEIVAQVACGFSSVGSGDAEAQAVERGSKWAPGVAIYSDSRDLPDGLSRQGILYTYLPAGGRGRPAAHDLAHVLSVTGRCRAAATDPSDVADAIAKAKVRAGMSDKERRFNNVNILLDHASKDPAFAGDFEALAERLGWTSGKLWRHNPAIKRAAARWAILQAPPTTKES